MLRMLLLMYWSKLQSRPREGWLQSGLSSFSRLEIVTFSNINVGVELVHRKLCRAERERSQDDRLWDTSLILSTPFNTLCGATGNTIPHDQTTKNLCNHWQKSILIDLAEQYPMFIVYRAARILANSNPYLLTIFNENHKVNADHICC